jgi:hypothetical protein
MNEYNFDAQYDEMLREHQDDEKDSDYEKDEDCYEDR